MMRIISEKESKRTDSEELATKNLPYRHSFDTLLNGGINQLVYYLIF